MAEIGSRQYTLYIEKIGGDKIEYIFVGQQGRCSEKRHDGGTVIKSRAVTFIATPVVTRT